MIRSLALSLTVVTVLGAAETTSPLNVIVYLVDDLGQRDLGCYGSASYATPAIDRLAAEGLRFTEAYSAYPRCVPSRFAMMSGVHPARATAGKSNDVSGRPTLGTAFTQAGYRTFYAGLSE